MIDRLCNKYFPKEYCVETTALEDGYPVYRRRSLSQGGRVFMKDNGDIIDNSWVVPYNPFLTTKYDAHINVEICNTVQAIKYLFKYVYKGHDRASVSIENISVMSPTIVSTEPPNIDNIASTTTYEVSRPVNEIKKYVDGRSVCPNEAFWRIFGYTLQEKYPAVERLPVHLQNGQTVIFNEGTELQILERGPPVTKLTAYFDRVKFERLQPLSSSERGYVLNTNILNPTALDILYAEFVSFYTWIKKEKKWSRRKGCFDTISRIYTMQMNTESFYLRMLLYTRVNMASFLELKTVHGAVLETYKDVCVSLGLLANDNEWIQLFDEISMSQPPKQLRNLFAIILVYNAPENPRHLFHTYKDSFSDDYRYERVRLLRDRSIPFTETDYSEALWV